MSRNKSKILLQKARNLKSEDEEKAIEIYQNIIEMDGSWSVPYYNLGLIYKYNGQWQKSYEFNKKATELDATDEAAWWNLGIACTALNKWREARIAWNRFGLDLDINDTEVSMDLGPAPIRLQNDEIVWTTRVCPARAYIENISLEDSEYRYNDLILIDGSPTGTEILDGVEYSVFNELEIIKKSEFSTYLIGVEVDNFDEIRVLENECYNLNYGFDNWTILCKQCSEDIPHETHDDELKNNLEEYNLAIATTTLDELEKVLELWMQTNEAVVNWIE